MAKKSNGFARKLTRVLMRLVAITNFPKVSMGRRSWGRSIQLLWAARRRVFEVLTICLTPPPKLGSIN